jgi:molybdopterin-guanine dinucleotide biosynthesis protein
MILILVGGHSRNVGKTSVVEGIIRALPEMDWTAVKITQFGHGVCSINGESCGCEVNEHQFEISEESETDTGTDTARFLAAGAKRSLWVRTKQGELVTALPSLREELENDRFVIVESNSLRRFLKPQVYLQVLDPLNPDFKLSAQQFFDLADAYLLVKQNDSDPREIIERNLRNKPFFLVTPQEHFISQQVVEFVKSKIDHKDTKTQRSERNFI